MKKKKLGNLFLLTLKIAEQEYRAEASTLLEALEKLLPDMIKGKGVLRIEKGELSKEMVLYPWKIKRLINNKLARTLFSKQVGLIMG